MSLQSKMGVRVFVATMVVLSCRLLGVVLVGDGRSGGFNQPGRVCFRPVRARFDLAKCTKVDVEHTQLL